MKKLRLVMMLIFCSHCYPVYAQSYTPFPETNALWKVIRCFSFYPPGWYDVFTFTQSGDTLISGIGYHKIYETVHHLPGTQYDTTYTYYLGAMREDQQKIYLVSEFATGDTIPRILYDFSVQEEGDIIYSHLLNYGDPITVKSMAGAIDSVLIDGEYRRRIHLNTIDGYPTNEKWIEGIGSNFGLIFPCFYLVTDNSYDLRCFSAESFSYQNNELGLGYCLSLPEVGCDFATATPPVSVSPYFSVFPNPARDHFYIQSSIPDDNPVTATLYSMLGEEVFRQTIQPAAVTRLNAVPLPCGIFLLQLIHANGRREMATLILE